jgi:hypothetical protein
LLKESVFDKPLSVFVYIRASPYRRKAVSKVLTSDRKGFTVEASAAEMDSALPYMPRKRLP